MLVQVSNRQRILPLSLASVRKVVIRFLISEGVTCDEVSIGFVDVPTICDLHSRFFNDPSPTDCITCPIDPPNSPGYCVLGEVFISPQAAIDYVIAENPNAKPDKEKIYWELTLYLIHGLLHLLGYDDIEEEEERKMRAAEQRILKILRSEGIRIKSTT